MKVIIPLAGFGKRLRPHTYSVPKPLINVAGKPILGHVIDMFQSIKTDEFIFVTGYLREQIEAYLSEEYPDLRTRCVEQVDISGQSQAVLLTKDYVDGPVLLVFVDTIIDADLTPLQDETCEALAWVKRVRDPRRFGVAELNQDGYVSRLIEKPSSMDNNLVVVGFYYLRDGPGLMNAIEAQIAANLQTKGEYYLADALQIMLSRGLKMRVKEVDVWEDCGNPNSMLHTNKYLLEHGHDNSAEVKADGFIVVPPVNIHPNAQIKNSVIGPCVTIAADCQIDCAIVRESIVGEGAQIEDALVTQSLIGKRAHVKGHYNTFNISDDSEVGFA